MIPNDVIDEIRHRCNLIDVISEVTRLKRSGSNWMACCPFHEEKTPSFSVSEEKQLYHCFGCGESGTVFSFMMNFHRLTFPETLERLATKVGIELAPYEQGQSAEHYKKTREHKKNMADMLSYASECFEKCLKASSRAQAARKYMLERSYDTSVQQKWSLGFAPAGSQHVYQALLKKGFKEELMLQSGLIGKNEKGVYDMYRNRIIFPISDFEGGIIAFGARVMDASKPKYINSPEHILFNKRRVLYGLSQAKDSIKSSKRALIVEGYTDVISLHQHGVKNAVASLGTAFTKDHAKLIRKYTHEVVFVFDGDIAGASAAYKSLIPSVSEGIDARVVFLDTGDDPDSVSRNDEKLTQFKSDVLNAPKLLDYFLDKEFSNSKEIHKKSKAIEYMVELVKETKDVYLKEALVDRLQQISGLDKEIFYGKSQYVQKPFSVQNTAGKSSSVEKQHASLSAEESLMLRILAQIPQSIDRYFEDKVDSFFTPIVRDHVLQWLDTVRDKIGAFEAARAIDLWQVNDHKSVLSKAFLQDDYNIESDWKKIWDDCVRKMKQRKIKFLTAQLGKNQNVSHEQVKHIFSEIERLKKTLRTHSKSKRS